MHSHNLQVELPMANGGELQQVFDLCSPDAEGYILTDYLADKLAEQLNDQDLDTIKSVLDPRSRGKISFDQFKGAISEIQESTDRVTNLPDAELEPRAGGEESEEESEHSTPYYLRENEEDIQHITPVSKILYPNKTSTPYCRDDEGSSSDPENTYNEYDVPDGDDMAHSVNGDDLPGFESYEAMGESPGGTRIRRNTEQLSIPQESNFKRRSSMRRSHRRAHSFSFRGGGISPGLIQDDQSTHDETSSVTSDLEDLSEKVDILQDHVAKLTEEKNLQAQYETVNSENQQLKLQKHDLDEKLSDALEKIEQLKRDSETKLEDLRCKLTREHQLLTEVIQSKLQNSEQEKIRIEGGMKEAKALLTLAKQDTSLLQAKVEGLTAQVMQTNEEYRHLNNQANAQRERFEEERVYYEEGKENLRMQLEETLNDKNALTERLTSLDLNQSPSAALLSAKLADLEMENERLKLANEDLNVQLARNIVDARLLIGKNDNRSIAAEMDNATRDEVVEALQDKEQENAQLREYLDKIILNILEKDPGILEIK